MKYFNSQKQLLDFIKENDPDCFEFTSELRGIYAHTDYEFYKQSNSIKNKAFEDIGFINIDFNQLGFEGCSFNRCKFRGIKGFFLNFYKCNFLHTEFINSELTHSFSKSLVFTECSFRIFYLNESDLINVKFKGCDDVKMVSFGCDSYNVTFSNCTLTEDVFYGPGSCNNGTVNYKFKNCSLEFLIFLNSCLKNSRFIDCEYYKLNFNDCELSNTTFQSNNIVSAKGFCNIDLRTIISSETLDYNILNNLFGITINYSPFFEPPVVFS
jgi:fluoroquinolone resistance protein